MPLRLAFSEKANNESCNLVKMKIIILLIAASVCSIINCCFTENVENEGIKIEVLNDYIGIPANDSISCADTLRIKFVNPSKNTYYFNLSQQFIAFSDQEYADKEFYTPDPFDGIAIRFLTNDSLTLEARGADCFDCWDKTPPVEDKLIVLMPESVLTVESPLVFPNISTFNYYQYVENLEMARSIEILLEHNSTLSQIDLELSNIKNDPSHKIAQFKERFLLETKIICE